MMLEKGGLQPPPPLPLPGNGGRNGSIAGKDSAQCETREQGKELGLTAFQQASGILHTFLKILKRIILLFLFPGSHS